MKWRAYVERILLGALVPMLVLAGFAAMRPAVWKWPWFPPFFWSLVTIVGILVLLYLILYIVGIAIRR